MSAIHKRSSKLEGAAACGCNVFTSWKEPGVKKVARRQFVFFETENNPATCKRCLNQVARPKNVTIQGDMAGKIFHRSFGYDMTFNVFCKVVGQTAKGLRVQECNTSTNGEQHYPGGSGKGWAGDLKKDSKPFLMFRKVSGHGYEHWSGGGHGWSLTNGRTEYYENRVD